MSRPLRTRLIGVAIVSACGFTATNMQPTREDSATSPIDSSMDAYIPDSMACARGSAECIAGGGKIRVCDSAGATPHDDTCTWSCLDSPEAHCAKLVPSGGTVTTADLESSSLNDIVINASPMATINTDDGSISGVRTAGPGIISGIDYTVRGNVAVFRFNKLTVNGSLLTIRGKKAIAIVSITDITINAEVNAQGDCSAKAGGPGGGDGGDNTKKGAGSGGGGSGTGNDNDCTGGGGGGDGADGGNGGGANNKGTAFGSPTIAALTGGGGGGGGGGLAGGDGGGGGGGVQLVANTRITINGVSPAVGGINAGGCGGRGATSCGGGGGAGGLILIEAPVIDFKTSKMAVNGGGGGGGSDGGNGERGNLSTSQASGGNGGGGPGAGNSGGDGGDGGDNGVLTGGAGEDKSHAGGGGGGVGRMRFNTLSGSVLTSGPVVFSPDLTTSTTTTTVSRGMAVIK